MKIQFPWLKVVTFLAVQFLCSVFFPTSVLAITNYVAIGGNHISPFTSWVDAANDIQSAVNVATAGNTVLVDKGTYELSTYISIANGITVQSLEGIEATVVDGNDSTRCFKLSHSNAVVTGFTITGGAVTPNGGGVYLDYGGTVTNCLITGNSAAEDGGGVYFNYGGTVRNCTISSNSAIATLGDGGGVVCYHGGMVQNCIIVSNSANVKGGGVACFSGGTVRNCLITRNSANGSGGGVYCDSVGTVESCTIVSNSAGNKGGGVYFYYGGTVENTIIYFNASVNDGTNWYNFGSGMSYSYSCTFPMASGESNIINEPDFVNVAQENYHLISSSPCVDSGTNRNWMTNAVDLDGEERIDNGTNGTVDMGAYEYDSDAGSGALQCNFDGSPRIGLSPLEVIFTASVTGTNTTNLDYFWDFYNDGTNDPTRTNDVVTNVYSWAVDRYSVGLIVSNAVGEEATRTKWDYIQVYPATNYVSLQGSNIHPYASWQTAATNIQSAVSAAGEGAVVLVTNGTYVLSAQISLAKKVTVQSVNGYGITIVDGSNSVRCFYLTNSHAVVDGFTITKGVAANDGGGIYCFDGTVRNCLITGNLSTNDGGGMYCCENGMVQNCTISNNMAKGNGGGMYFYSGGVVTNSTITGNLAQGHGGGVYCDLTGTVQNCTLSNNSSTNKGGGVYANGIGSIVENCLITGNSSTNYGGGVYLCESSTVQNCIISNNFTKGPMQHGGGVYCGQGDVVRNCVISGNFADGSLCDGGGVFCRQGGTIQNCTIVGNSATDRGGGVFCWAGGIVQNTIIYFNTADTANNWTNFAGGMSGLNCSSIPLVSTNSITNAPQFVNSATGNYHLVLGSFCIDDGAANGAPSNDLDGVSRPLDGDNDGMNSFDIGAYEFVHPTADSDGDGLTDMDEIYTYLTDPLDPDTDDDGLTDWDEVITYPTDPLDPDSDDDNMPDGWEVGYGLDPTNAIDADGDPDNDYMISVQEYTADTDPTNKNSVLAITNIVKVVSGVRIGWKGGIQATQYLEWLEDLTSTTELWKTLFTNAPATPPATNFVDMTTNQVQFYRIKVERKWP